ncbi:winged helix-turn-helix domain-containing protein [Halovulum dunhuangense]|uniref:Winged helix-turn-helix domain-containing protein n=1 Tax=Halovulum dunhuangense TaxID=1505036 RepID=A0A849L1M4_9RHOB|nr:winged helix-turn-helix domain-containing protein [Halovulum dunhuangense]
MKDIDERDGVWISPDFAFLETEAGARIGLTRSERRALKLLTAHPNRLLSRDEILDAVSEPGSDKNDRNIDFLVNRLRRKLSDDARNPRYIATRYGEGYVWIGEAPIAQPAVAGADMVVSAVNGLDNLGDTRETGEGFARALPRAFEVAMGADRRVVYAPGCAGAAEFGAAAPALAAELSFFVDRGHISCVVAVRDFRSGRLIAARRQGFENAVPVRAAAERLARQLYRQVWRVTATMPVRDVPLPVGIYGSTMGESIPLREEAEASNRKMLALAETAELRSLATWQENEKRLRAMLAETPHDAEAKLLLAIAIHSKYVMGGQRLLVQGIDTRGKDEDDMEALVTEALPYVRDKPDHAIMAGKLLHFLRRGYDDLARDLCEEAYATSVSPAGSLAVIGQMRAFAGETDSALDAIEQALNLSPPGSHAHAYALVIKGQALAGAARWDDLKSVRKETYGVSPVLGLMLEPVFAHPGRESYRARAVMLLFSRARAEAQLRNLNYVCARLFRDPAQGANALRPFSGLFAGRFGTAAIPQEVRSAHPRLFAEIS